MKELIDIQNELKVPKNHYNDHGKYYYRNCEDILEALKPLCKKHNCILTLTDEMLIISDRFYVKATASICFPIESKELMTGEPILAYSLPHSVSAYAREPLTNNAKMDASQITGSASTYARKFALGALFLIDDNKDADSGKGGDGESIELITPEQIKTLEAYSKDYKSKDKTKYDFIINCLEDPNMTYKNADIAIKRIKESKT